MSSFLVLSAVTMWFHNNRFRWFSTRHLAECSQLDESSKLYPICMVYRINKTLHFHWCSSNWRQRRETSVRLSCTTFFLPLWWYLLVAGVATPNFLHTALENVEINHELLFLRTRDGVPKKLNHCSGIFLLAIGDIGFVFGTAFASVEYRSMNGITTWLQNVDISQKSQKCKLITISCVQWEYIVEMLS